MADCLSRFADANLTDHNYEPKGKEFVTPYSRTCILCSISKESAEIHTIDVLDTETHSIKNLQKTRHLLQIYVQNYAYSSSPK